MRSGYYRCKKEYKSPYPESILFKAREKVILGEEFNQDPDWKDWIRCQTDDGREAWIPKQFLDIKAGSGKLLKEYDALELSISVGENIYVHEIVNGFGMAQKQNGERGWIPMNHLEFHSNGENKK